ncbi:hypothetical protein [Treponema sp. R6D11]
MEDYTEKNELLAEKILGWYKSAWKDKDERGFFDLWERIEAYWEGIAHNVNHGDEINTNVNIIHPCVEGQVAILANQDIEVKCLPASPSEKAYAKKAETILNFIKEKNDMFNLIDSHERRRVKFGTGVLRVIYDPTAASGYGLPTIESVNPAYFFPDPRITDPMKLNEGEFVIETLRKPISWAKEYYGSDIADKIEKNYDPTGSVISQEDANTYLHILAWFRTESKLRLVEITGCGIILYDSFEKRDGDGFYPINRYPYFVTPLYRREGSIWAKGDAELLIPLQDLVDELDDQIRSNARLSGNPQRLVDISCNIDLDKWTNDSGLIIPTANIDGARYLTPPEMPDYPLRRREQALNYERQIVSRFSDQLAGTTEETQRTATEVELAIRQGNISLDYKRKILKNTLSNVFEYCFALAMAYYSSSKAFKGEDGEFVWLSNKIFKNIPLLGEDGERDSYKATAEFEIKVEL